MVVSPGEQRITEAVRRFWDSEPCGSELSEAEDERRYFDELTRRRYELESHIPEIADFGIAGGDATCSRSGRGRVPMGSASPAPAPTTPAVDVSPESFKARP